MHDVSRTYPRFADSSKALDNCSLVSVLHVISDFILNGGRLREVQLFPYKIQEVSEVFELSKVSHCGSGFVELIESVN